MSLPILTGIKYGQKYVDEPIYSKPAKRLITKLADTLAELLGRVTYVHLPASSVGKPKLYPVRIRTDLPPEILLRYDHVKLRWLKPDGKGGVAPR